ncbi:MAG: hypothetical protein KIT02_07415 [Devosia sp.]|uniref:hypothetical protein n=1 Tax=Devosia sp. TaxID=1871048 RepID=UPI0024C68825|nr:hypothetical protein [Devosia sp.]UYO01021.1 MAG: hypothetical protein KIT02_07415 [Devosia sp.]
MPAEVLDTTVTVRPAGPQDVAAIANILLLDAGERCAADPGLWGLVGNAQEKVVSSIRSAMKAETPPLRQQWLVAEAEGQIVGVTHSILLPVPPIYAGELGPPGLIMEDCHVSPVAPPSTREKLFQATQADLIGVGARLLLASSVAGGSWESEYVAQGFEPVTLYYAKTGLCLSAGHADTRPATETDVTKIVASSALNRRILQDLHPTFWKTHKNADAHFEGWMKHSLSLIDRDMFVAETGNRFEGYAISQPATWLHFPSAHDISDIGVIDDFFHVDLMNPPGASSGNASSMALLVEAEAARQERGDRSVLVVCPAAWRAKIDLLEKAGYRKAITWLIKIIGQ